MLKEKKRNPVGVTDDLFEFWLEKNPYHLDVYVEVFTDQVI